MAGKCIFFGFCLHISIKITTFAARNETINRIINILNHTIMSEIESKVKAIIVDKLGVDEAEVSAEKSFTGDLGADSLDTVELIMEFENVFGIDIPDNIAEKISTVGDVIKYIEDNQKAE